MKKRITVSILAAAMSLTVVSCGNNVSSGDSGSSISAEQAAPVGNEYSFKETTENTTTDFNAAAAEFSAELFKKLSAYIFESADRPAYHLRKINRIEQHFQGIVKWFRSSPVTIQQIRNQLKCIIGNA